MKTKKWIKALCIALGIILFLAAAFFTFAAVMTYKGYGVSVGRALLSKDDSCMLVVDENSPIIMRDRSDKTGKGELFSRISTGDKILVFHDGVAESYPSQTGAYFIIKLGGGDIDDIPDKIIDELMQMGWLAPEQ